MQGDADEIIWRHSHPDHFPLSLARGEVTRMISTWTRYLVRTGVAHQASWAIRAERGSPLPFRDYLKRKAGFARL